MSKNLQLSLKSKWFEMTKPDGKCEDYRDINEYWLRRLCYVKERVTYIELPDVIVELKYGNFTKELLVYKPFTTNTMTLGYPKSTNTSRIKVFEHAGIEIRTGKEEWGAEPGKLYFVIKHGKQLQ